MQNFGRKRVLQNFRVSPEERGTAPEKLDIKSWLTSVMFCFVQFYFIIDVLKQKQYCKTFRNFEQAEFVESLQSIIQPILRRNNELVGFVLKLVTTIKRFVHI